MTGRRNMRGRRKAGAERCARADFLGIPRNRYTLASYSPRYFCVITLQHTALQWLKRPIVRTDDDDLLSLVHNMTQGLAMRRAIVAQNRLLFYSERRRTTCRSRRRCHAKFYRRAGKFWHDVASRRGTLRRLASYCELGLRRRIIHLIYLQY